MNILNSNKEIVPDPVFSDPNIADSLLSAARSLDVPLSHALIKYLRLIYAPLPDKDQKTFQISGYYLSHVLGLSDEQIAEKGCYAWQYLPPIFSGRPVSKSRLFLIRRILLDTRTLCLSVFRSQQNSYIKPSSKVVSKNTF